MLKRILPMVGQIKHEDKYLLSENNLTTDRYAQIRQAEIDFYKLETDNHQTPEDGAGNYATLANSILDTATSHISVSRKTELITVAHNIDFEDEPDEMGTLRSKKVQLK
jgi:hypothetical protein